MPSTSSRPSASFRRTPSAETTGSGAVAAGIGPYGCHTRRRSSSSRSSTRATLLAGGLQDPATGRGRAGAGVDRDEVDGQRLEGRLGGVDEAREAHVGRLGEVAGAARADA